MSHKTLTAISMEIPISNGSMAKIDAAKGNLRRRKLINPSCSCQCQIIQIIFKLEYTHIQLNSSSMEIRV